MIVLQCCVGKQLTIVTSAENLIAGKNPKIGRACAKWLTSKGATVRHTAAILAFRPADTVQRFYDHGASSLQTKNSCVLEFCYTVVPLLH